MPKSLVLGNGNVLLCFDHRAQLRDLYFHYVGHENHMGDGCVNRVGVWVDGQFSWFDDPEWDIVIDYKKDSLVGEVTATNDRLEIQLTFQDTVYNEKNIFIRKVRVNNLANHKRIIRTFFNHQLQIYGTNTGNSAFFDPEEKAIVHYKGRRVFLFSGSNEILGFDSYSIGRFFIDSDTGTWKDAEDGRLSNNPIEHGSVDSTVFYEHEVDAKGTYSFSTWMTVGKSLKEVKKLHSYVMDKSPEYLLESTSDYWKAWSNKRNFTFYGLDMETIDLFKKSLLIIRTHVNNTGGIIASGDSDMLQFGRDTYSYVWPRDASFIAMALNRAGYYDVSRRHFEFCKDVITDEGYMYQKYLPDQSMGSSWHPWVNDRGEKKLPIQEDETALVVISLWDYYQRTKDLEFVETLYNPLIKKAANFMVQYRDERTSLPMPSYELWEMKWGISTFTASTVSGALWAASEFAKLLGKEKDQELFSRVSGQVKNAIIKYLYSPEDNYFYKLIDFGKDGRTLHDRTIDTSSFYGVFNFGIVDMGDEMLTKSHKVLLEKLTSQSDIDGVARFVNDQYHKPTNGPANPWFVTTLWHAQYLIEKAKDQKDLEEVKHWLSWVVNHSGPSGVLSEQIDSLTGEQKSASPLVWSHAEFVSTLILYLEKLEKMGICKVCYPLKG